MFCFWLLLKKEKVTQLKCLTIEEENDKKVSWFTWLFQTFKTVVVVARSATKFPHAFSYKWQNCFLLAIVKIKTNLKLAYAVYCALSSSIIKCMSYDYIIHITSIYKIYAFDFFYFTIKWTKWENQFKKVKRNFLFYFIECKCRIINKSTQTTNSRNFGGASFC